VTHVLRGEDLLSSTPRQIVLYAALIEIGVAKVVPQFAHLPYVMGEGNKKLSKRDPESNIFHHRERGFIPEGLTNYLSLLGWSLSADRDVFTMDEMTAAFDVADVNPNPARFDLRKAAALNGDHIRQLAPADFAGRLLPYLAEAGLVSSPPTPGQLAVLDQAAPLVQERMQLLGEAPGLLGFLFTDSADLEYQADALAGLPEGAAGILASAATALEAVPDWDHESIQASLNAALVDGLGLKPRVAFGPLRTAISGRRVSPPLFESMQILGRGASLERLALLTATLASQTH
jgi:glutamyl-tRNA synthetase